MRDKKKYYLEESKYKKFTIATFWNDNTPRIINPGWFHRVYSFDLKRTMEFIKKETGKEIEFIYTS